MRSPGQQARRATTDNSRADPNIPEDLGVDAVALRLRTPGVNNPRAAHGAAADVVETWSARAMAASRRRLTDLTLSVDLPPVNPAQRRKYKDLLNARHDEIVAKAGHRSPDEGPTDDELPDEMDLSSGDLSSFTLTRVRGRDRAALDAIRRALEKIEDGTFGACDKCNEEIDSSRLEAHPEAALCARCHDDPSNADAG